jgi:Rieske Fe-S protein
MAVLMTEATKTESKKTARRSITRREFVKVLVSLGFLGTAVSFLSLLASILPAPKGEQEEGEIDNVFKYGQEKGSWYSAKSGSEVLLEDFDQVGKGAAVLWRGSIPAVLMRVDEKKLRGATATSGLIAFASTCTHLCCIATWHFDRPNEDVLFCRCHDGIFDPYDVVKDVMPDGADYSGAKVIAGPPPRPTPIIPIEIKDGKVAGVPTNLDIYGYCE